MSPRADPDVDSGDRRTLALLVAILALLSALVVLPYLPYILAAIVLAYVLYPLQRRLERVVGRTAGALIGLVVATVAILAPVVVLVAVAIQQGLELATAVAAGEFGIGALETRLDELGIGVDLETLYAALEEPISIGARGIAVDALQIVGGLPGFLIGVTVLLFVLYSLLRDGDRLVHWGKSVLPLRAELQSELVVRVDRLLWASIVANVVVAAVQALLTVIGLAIAGVPGLTFFGILTFVLALLPLIGAFAVWAPVAVYLIAVGQPISGGFLIVYGTLVVSLSDNFLRPVTVGRGANMSAATVVVGIFGGVALVGVMGLFFGPVVLGALKTLLELYAREQETAAAPISSEHGDDSMSAEEPDERRDPGWSTPPAEPVDLPASTDPSASTDSVENSDSSDPERSNTSDESSEQ